MDELVAQHVEPVKENSGEGYGILLSQREPGGAAAAVEPPLPFGCFFPAQPLERSVSFRRFCSGAEAGGNAELLRIIGLRRIE